MEIPIIDSGILGFQTPSLHLHLKAFWTWGALILAALAMFSSLMRKSKRAFLRLRKIKSVISLPAYSCCSDVDDDDDVSCSSSDEDDDDVDEDIVSAASGKDSLDDFEEIQGQNGEYDESFTLSELARDGHVVKFWDGLGLGYKKSNGTVSLLDLNRNETLRSFFWESEDIPAAHMTSPDIVLAAGSGGGMVWDARSTAPDSATCHLDGDYNVVGFGDKKIYFGDDMDRLRVVDLRNVILPF